MALVCLTTILIIVLAYSFISVLMSLGRMSSTRCRDAMVCTLGPLVLVVYVFIGCARGFAQHSAADVPIDPAVPTTMIYLLKLVIALMMYRINDGTFAEMAKSIFENKLAALS